MAFPKKINLDDPKTINVIVTNLKKSPDNLSQAFQRSAETLNSTPGTLSFHWYKNGLRERVGQVFTLNSDKSKFTNRKNTITRNNGKMVHEKIISSTVVEGLRVVTVKQYYAV